MDVRPIDALSRDAVAAVIADVATRIETARSG
jgi:hypothetical protein